MSSRNLSDLFFMLRSSALSSNSIFLDNKNSDNMTLLKRNYEESGNFFDQPGWIGKYDEIQYVLSKIKQRVGDLLHIYDSSVRLVLSETPGYAVKIKEGFSEISKLITTCHSQIKTIKTTSKSQNQTEFILLQNVEKNLLTTLVHITDRFRQTHSAYVDKQINLEQKSSAFFEKVSTNFEPMNSVDTFDNFLNIKDDGTDSQLDQYFQLPASGTGQNHKQLLIVEADNNRMIQNREQEVVRIVNSLTDLNFIFKDLSQMIVEQGTILDRIDHNILSTETKVFEGYNQLQKTEKYQRKNKKLLCIVVLASMIMFMLILTVFTKL